MRTQTKFKIKQKGRMPNLKAIQVTHQMINEKKLSFRDALPVIAKKLGKEKVDIKSVYRWYSYETK